MISLADVTRSSTSSAELLQVLSTYGVVRLTEYLPSDLTAAILDEARIATESMANYRNPYGPCARFSLDTLPPHLSHSRDLVAGDHVEPLPRSLRHAREVMSANIFQELVGRYLGSGAGFMEVIAFTRDHVPDAKAVYGKLHFDRRHQLKVIVYLNDVDDVNGAFGCIPGSHRLGRDRFVAAWRRVLGMVDGDEQMVEKAAAAVPEDHPNYHRVPCILRSDVPVGDFLPQRDRLTVGGPAGTIVIFDSHVLHYGGFVSPGTERWTLKGHTFAIAGNAG